MRDPLALIPVRYKLPLTFAFLCAVAFGFGGYIVLSTAREALEKQIEARLEERATATDLVVDKGLELLGRRVEDFASDGHIRLELERLEQGRAEAGAELVRHLQVNKLPLVQEFTDAFLMDRSGRVLVHARKGAPGAVELRGNASLASIQEDAFWYGPLKGPGPVYRFPHFILSTPVRAIEGGQRIGYLQLVVRADRWADRLRRTFPDRSPGRIQVAIGQPDGYRLPLYPEEDGASSEWYTVQSPSSRTGWTVEVGMNRRIMLEPVRALIWKFTYLGIALVFLALLLLLPSRQFLLKPLSQLEAAAEKLTEGDFSARVGYRSDDEVGHLSHAFDVMAAAIQERTQRLFQAAKEVRTERDRLNTVIHSMKDGLFILDREGSVILANEAARTVLEEIDQVRRADPRRDCGKTGGGFKNCLKCLSDYTQPARNCVVAIGSRTFEIRSTSLLDSAGEETGRVFVSRDITERILRSAQEAHQERLSVLGEVAAVMAHEMNNPLAAISMFNQMLMKELDPGSDLHRHAEVIARNTETCSRAIRSLLDMARPSAAEFEPFDLQDLVHDVIQMLRPVADRSRVELAFRTSGDHAVVRGDELQLRQAVVNLVMNGIQAAREEEGAGQVRLEVLEEGNDTVLRVQDNGPGVPEDLKQRIFEPFFTTKPVGEGTGLGLPTTRRIVDAHGGRLQVRDAPEGGAVFEIWLPRAKAEEGETGGPE